MTSYTRRSAGKLFGVRPRSGVEPREFASIEAAARLAARNMVGRREPTVEVVERKAVGLPWRVVPEATWRAALAVAEPAL